MKSRFDRVIWLGRPPLNRARETLCRDLLAMLSFNSPMETAFTEATDVRTLILGNVEDWQLNPANWPRSDGKQIYIGLFAQATTPSQKILASFIDDRVSFYWNDSLTVGELREVIADLLCS